jgi:hypothetical protein
VICFWEGGSTLKSNLLLAGMAALAMSADAVRQAADLGTLSPLVPCIPLFLAGAPATAALAAVVSSSYSVADVKLHSHVAVHPCSCLNSHNSPVHLQVLPGCLPSGLKSLP